MEQIDNSLKEPEEELTEAQVPRKVSDTIVEDDGQTREDIIIEVEVIDKLITSNHLMKNR